MSEQILEEKVSFDGKRVKVLGPCYEEGKPDQAAHANWRDKLLSREDMLAYLKTGVR